METYKKEPRIRLRSRKNTFNEYASIVKNRINTIRYGDKRKTGVMRLLALSALIALSTAAIVIIVIHYFDGSLLKPKISRDSGIAAEDPVTSLKDTSGNALIKKGRESLERGYLSEAATLFNEVLESGSVDADKALALIYLGIISDKKGEYERAINQFSRAADYDRDNPEIYYNLALTYRKIKDYKSALEAAEKGVSVSDKDPRHMTLLGNIYYETGRYKDAVKIYNEALSSNPDNSALLYNLGSALLESGDEFAAIERLKEAGASDRIGEIAYKAYLRLGVLQIDRKNYELSEKYLKLALSIRPLDPVTHYNLGISYARQNKEKEASEQFTRAAEYGSTDLDLLENIGEAFYSVNNFEKSLELYNKIALVKSRNVRILSRIGDIHYKLGEVDRAFDAYEKITLLEPATENARVAYLNMGNIYDDTGRYSDAIEAYNKALSIDRLDPAAYYNLGIAYKNAGKPELAISSWDRAIELNPADPAPAVAKADYYLEKGINDLALRELSVIASKWPNSPQAQAAHFKIGEIYYVTGSPEYAIKAYDRAILVNESSDYARRSHVKKAVLLAGLRDDEDTFEECLSIVKKALLIKPSDPEALNAMGIIYSGKSYYKRAIEIFYQALAASGDSVLNAGIYENIGKAHYSLGEYKKALAAFTQGIEEDPSSESLRINRKATLQEYEAQLRLDR